MGQGASRTGGGLKPKVHCIGELADQGIGDADFGLYAAAGMRDSAGAQ